MEWIIVGCLAAVALVAVCWGLDHREQVLRRQSGEFLLDDQVRQSTALAQRAETLQCELRRLRISAQSACQRADLAEQVRDEAVRDKEREQARGDELREKLAEVDQLAERIRELTGGGNDDWRRPIVVGEPEDLIVLEAGFLGPGHAALYARVLRGRPAVWQGDAITVCIDSCMMQFGTEQHVLSLERRVHCEAFDGFYGIVPDGPLEEICDAVRQFNISFRETEVSNVSPVTEGQREDHDRRRRVDRGRGGSRRQGEARD